MESKKSLDRQVNIGLLKRLIISQIDLQQAEEYARYICDHKLCDKNSYENELLHKALNTALIIAYSRPFSSNKSSRDVKAALPQKYARVFDSKEKALHKRILEMRNKEFAHSDPRAFSLTLHVNKNVTIPMSRDPSIPIPESETEMVKTMIDKLLNKIREERSIIENKLPESAQI